MRKFKSNPYSLEWWLSVYDSINDQLEMNYLDCVEIRESFGRPYNSQVKEMLQ